jgi:hypothetical protein
VMQTNSGFFVRLTKAKKNSAQDPQLDPNRTLGSSDPGLQPVRGAFGYIPGALHPHL